jgi:1-phosphofructokinase family hexose kinase
MVHCASFFEPTIRTMILTVTPNPSIDLLHETDRLVWDDANRVEMPRRRAGGQGINLTRAVRVLGGESKAIAFFGGATGEELRRLLKAENVDVTPVAINGETRVFVSVRENSTGHSMLLNPRGPILTEDDRVRLLQTVASVCAQSKPDWVVCAGSIPRGIGNDIYGFIAGIAHSNGARFVADCDGEALAYATQHDCDLLAPNQHEAERLLNDVIVSVQDAGTAARSLLSAAPTVLLKLGEKGAVLANAHGCWHARSNALMHGSAVGAGDSFLGAYLVAEKRKAPPYEALREAVAAGTAVLLSKDQQIFAQQDFDAVLADVVVTPL